MKSFKLLSVLTTTTVLSVAGFVDPAQAVESFGAIGAVSTPAEATTTVANPPVALGSVQTAFATKENCEVVDGIKIGNQDCITSALQNVQIEKRKKADAETEARNNATLAAQAVKDQVTASTLAKTNATNAAKALTAAVNVSNALANQIKPLETAATNAQTAMLKAQTAYDKACAFGSVVGTCNTLKATLDKAITANTAAAKALTDKQTATAAAVAKAQEEMKAAATAHTAAEAAVTKAAEATKAAADAKVAADAKLKTDSKIAADAAALAKLMQDHIDAAVKAADAAYAKAIKNGYTGTKTIEETFAALPGLYDMYLGEKDNAVARDQMYTSAASAQGAARKAYMDTLGALERAKPTGLDLTLPSKYVAELPKPPSIASVSTQFDADGNLITSGNPTAEAAAKAASLENANSPALDQNDPTRLSFINAVNNGSGSIGVKWETVTRMNKYFDSALYASDVKKLQEEKVKLAYVQSMANQFASPANLAALANVQKSVKAAEDKIKNTALDPYSNQAVTKFADDYAKANAAKIAAAAAQAKLEAEKVFKAADLEKAYAVAKAKNAEKLALLIIDAPAQAVAQQINILTSEASELTQNTDTVEKINSQTIAAQAKAILFGQISKYYKDCSTEALQASATCQTMAANFAMDMTMAKEGYLGAIVAVDTAAAKNQTSGANSSSAAHSAALIAAVTGNNGPTGAAGATGPAGSSGIAGGGASVGSNAMIVFPFLPNQVYRPPIESAQNPTFILELTKAAPGINNTTTGSLNDLRNLYHSTSPDIIHTPAELQQMVNDIVNRAIFLDTDGNVVSPTIEKMATTPDENGMYRYLGDEPNPAYTALQNEARNKLVNAVDFTKLSRGQVDAIVKSHGAIITAADTSFVVYTTPLEEGGSYKQAIGTGKASVNISLADPLRSPADLTFHECGHLCTDTSNNPNYPNSADSAVNRLHDEANQILRESSVLTPEQAWARLNATYGEGAAARLGADANIIAAAGVPENLTPAQKLVWIYEHANGSVESGPSQTGGNKGTINLGVLSDLINTNSGKPTIKPAATVVDPAISHVGGSALATKGSTALGIFGAYMAFNEFSQGYQTGDSTHMISGGVNLLDAIAGLKNSPLAGPTGIVAGGLNIYNAYKAPGGPNALGMLSGSGQLIVGSAVTIQALVSASGMTLGVGSTAMLTGAVAAGQIVMIVAAAAHATKDIIEIWDFKVGLDEIKAELDKDAQAKLSQTSVARDGSGKPDAGAYSHMFGISYINTGTGLSNNPALAALGVRMVEDPALIAQKLAERRAEVEAMEDDRDFMEKFWGGINPKELAMKELVAAEKEFDEYVPRFYSWTPTAKPATVNPAGGIINPINTLNIGNLQTSTNNNGSNTTTGINGNTISNTLGIGSLQPATGGLTYVPKTGNTVCQMGIITTRLTHQYDLGWDSNGKDIVTVKLYKEELCAGSVVRNPSTDFWSGPGLVSEATMPFEWENFDWDSEIHPTLPTFTISSASAGSGTSASTIVPPASSGTIVDNSNNTGLKARAQLPQPSSGGAVGGYVYSPAVIVLPSSSGTIVGNSNNDAGFKARAQLPQPSSAAAPGVILGSGVTIPTVAAPAVTTGTIAGNSNSTNVSVNTYTPTTIPASAKVAPVFRVITPTVPAPTVTTGSATSNMTSTNVIPKTTSGTSTRVSSKAVAVPRTNTPL